MFYVKKGRLAGGGLFPLLSKARPPARCAYIRGVPEKAPWRVLAQKLKPVPVYRGEIRRGGKVTGQAAPRVKFPIGGY